MRVWDTSHLLDDIPPHKRATAEHVYDPADSQANLQQIRLHFKQLQTRLILGLVLGFLLPNALLSAYFHFQFTHTLKESAKLNLAAVAESQKNTIDLYLQERVVNLYNLFHSKEFSLNPTQEQMDTLLASLKHFNDGFVDVGFFDTRGVQIGYAGPFPSLRSADYSGESWYRNLLTENKSYLISDIYMGFRKIPHFTIATKQVFDNRTYVMRATLDPDKFYIFLRAISQGKEVDSTLINHQGLYQVVDPGRSQLPGTGDYIPPATSASGVEEFERDDQKMLVAYAWLKETPWALLAVQPVAVAQAGMIKARLVLTVSLIVISLLISAMIYFTIKKLVDRARRMAEKGQQLQEMLAHASKLASIGELAAGVAHEINNPLAIIMATSGVIRDMLNPEFELDHSPEAIYKELSVIDTAANRAKGITRKLQDMGKSRVPSVVACDVNVLLDEVVSRLKKVEFKPKHIEVISHPAADLPPILAEPEPLRQVFANILINASDAIADKGTITITSEFREDTVWVTIADTGKGIPPENLQRIFNPFFTTKGGGRGTGLGLSIAASIVKYLGGTIKVNSIPGTGSSFTILLPINEQAKTTIKQHDN
ncbi:sensor histidine kinase [Desulfobulbus elongatus]|uniref:sensor histidine kinase n=1 Tax=Desulfobulbus elongatus TaxID=53332 RepID=UPI0004866E86|nr:PAS domain-containing sensor histidine kinase [Desulfobulbus elongatus]